MLIYILIFLLGFYLGIGFMCIFQINKEVKNDE